jgi:hypothetical protein
MSIGNRLDGAGLQTASVDYDKLTTNAITQIKASRLTALRNPVYTVSVPATSSSIVVSAEIILSSSTDVPQTTLNAKGIYVGVVSGPIDPLRTIITVAGSTDPISDSFGEAVYAKLTESAGVYTLSFFQSTNAIHTFVQTTNIDFYFVEIYGEDNRTTEAFLLSTVGSGGGAGGGISTQLQMQPHPSLTSKMIVTGSNQTLGNGEVAVLNINTYELYFNGGQVDFLNGIIYEIDGATQISTFTPPVIPLGEYFWYTLTVVPTTIDIQNRSVGQLVVIPASSSGASPDSAPRALWGVGLSVGQVVVQSSGGGFIHPITNTSFNKVPVGTISGGSPIKEIPIGAIDGINDTFTLNFKPIDPTRVLIYVNGLYQNVAFWSLMDNVITFSSQRIPNTASDLEVFYIPDPVSLVGGGAPGGSIDLTNISVNVTPDVNGSHALGTTSRGWESLYIKDQSSTDIWKIEIIGGVVQAILTIPGPPPIPGGGPDLTNVTVNMSPDVSGARSLGTDAKAWDSLYVKDQSNIQVWKLEVVGGALQVIAVP